MTAIPVELVAKIFQAVDSLHTALALSNTCKHLHGVWKVNANKILPCLVECFPQAQELAHAQQERLTQVQKAILAHNPDNFDASAPLSDAAWLPLIPSLRKPISTAQRIVINEDFAFHILRHYEKCFVSTYRRRSPPGSLTPSERANFLRALYRALTLATPGRSAIPSSLLSPLNLLEYVQLKEALLVLNQWFVRARMQASQVRVQPGTQPQRFKTSGHVVNASVPVSRASHSLGCFHDELMRLPVMVWDYWRWKDAESNHFKSGEGCPADVLGWERVSLMDLMPLMAQDCLENGSW